MDQIQDTTRARKWKHLSERGRYKIEALSLSGLTPTEISKQLGRDRRTIEREIARGVTVQCKSDLTEQMVYLADVGPWKHDERASNKGAI